MKLIERKTYLKQMIDVMNTPDIKVITGIRRSGKSKLLDAFVTYVEKQSENNIIRLNMNLKKFEALKDGNELYKYIDSHYIDGKVNFLFIDEI